MNKLFHDVINSKLSISVKKCNIITLKKSFTIANFYDIDNTIIFPIDGKLRYGKNKKTLEKNSALFISSHNTQSISFGSTRAKTLAYEDFIDKKPKYICEDLESNSNSRSEKFLIISIDVKAYDLINIFHGKYVGLDVFNSKNILMTLRSISNELKNKPVAVGGKAHERGVLTTCNYIAREYGLHSAMPTKKALSLCKNLVVLPVDIDKYKRESKEIFKVFKC